MTDEVYEAFKRVISGRQKPKVETLKYLMGHTDISVTSNVYTHWRVEDAKQELERMEKVEAELKNVAQ